MASIRLTTTTIRVLEVLLDAPSDQPAWGLSICQHADLGSGTVYPILERLLTHGWIAARMETGDHPGRPARRYYELTGAGRAAARAALDARKARRSPSSARWAGGTA